MRISQHPVIKKLISKCTSIPRKIRQHPTWKSLSNKYSSISVCQSNFRQLTVLVLMVIFLTSATFGNIQAASHISVPDTITAQKVILNGKESGYVSNQVSAEIIMDEILDEAASRFNMEVAAGNKLTFEETTILREELSTKNELEDSFRKNAKILVNAYTIYADDVSIGTLKSEEEAKLILNNIKAQYLSDEAPLEDASFQEDVKVLATPVAASQVQTMEDVEAELEKKQDTVEEYTLKEDDTFWSISREYKIKMDDLVKMNEDKDPKRLREGMVIRLSYPKSVLNVVTKELTKYEERIPYGTETQKDDSMYTNESKVIRQGQEGKDCIRTGKSGCMGFMGWIITLESIWQRGVGT
jgi:LysM repeat protein/biopolymer transport protein ExbD